MNPLIQEIINNPEVKPRLEDLFRSYAMDLDGLLAISEKVASLSKSAQLALIYCVNPDGGGTESLRNFASKGAQYASHPTMELGRAYLNDLKHILIPVMSQRAFSALEIVINDHIKNCTVANCLSMEMLIACLETIAPVVEMGNRIIALNSKVDLGLNTPTGAKVVNVGGAEYTLEMCKEIYSVIYDAVALAIKTKPYLQNDIDFADIENAYNTHGKYTTDLIDFNFQKNGINRLTIYSKVYLAFVPDHLKTR